MVYLIEISKLFCFNFVFDYHPLLPKANSTITSIKLKFFLNLETPAEQIVRKLTFARIEELNRSIETERERFKYYISFILLCLLFLENPK